MKQNYLQLKKIADQVVHAYSTYLHLGDKSKFKEVAPYFMREYIQNLYNDEDRSSEAYIRCYERIEHFLHKYVHSYASETNHLLPFLKRCAINQYLNVRKAELKLVRELPTVIYDDEYSQTSPSLSLLPSGRKRILLNALKDEDPKIAIAFCLKFDLPMAEEPISILYERLGSLGILQGKFWETHREKRMNWKSTKLKHLSRINHLNQKIMDKPYSPSIFKWKHYKQNRLKSLEYHLVIGLYSFSELGNLLEMTAESLARCLRYRTSKWKRTWDNSEEGKLEKKLDNFFPK